MKAPLLFLLSVLPFVPIAHGAKWNLEQLKGPEVVSGKAIATDPKERKGAVVVFLSAVCPCSNSHIQELTTLSRDFPEFTFLGVHSNTDETKEQTQAYFKEAKLPFPVIQDNGARIADELKAYKTPHAFIVKSDGEVLYQGGVSSSRNFENADRKFLREALDDLQKGRAVKTPEGRTLGCVISREGKNVW